MHYIKSYKNILTLLLLLLIGFAGLLSYFIITSDVEIDFQINWNMFNSILMWPLFIVGFIVGLGMKFTSYEPWTRKEYASGKVEYERNNDIIENMFAGCMMPILQYFVIGPIMIAAMIYYPLMTIIYLFGKIFPFLIIIFFILTLVLFFQWQRILIKNNNRNILMPLITFLIIGVLWLFFILWVPSESKYSILINRITVGLLIITTLTFIISAIWIYNKKKKITGHPSGPPDYYQPAAISTKFVTTYVISFLFVLGIYGFKASASYSNTNNKQSFSETGYETFIVNATTLNIRSGPDASYSKIGSLVNGKKIQVLDKTNNWAKVNYNGKTGYVNMEFLLPEKQKTSSLSTNETISGTKEISSNSSSNNSLSSNLSDIQKQTGIFTSFDFSTELESRARISVKERQELKIDVIGKNFLSTDLPNEQISLGKVIYQGNNGTLRTILHIIPDHATFEYLISYNGKNEVVACLMIGENMYYAGDKMFTNFDGDKFTTTYTYPDFDSEENKVYHSIYKISPDLNFIKEKEYTSTL